MGRPKNSVCQLIPTSNLIESNLNYPLRTVEMKRLFSSQVKSRRVEVEDDSRCIKQLKIYMYRYLLISPRSSNHSDPKDRNKLCALGKNNPLMFVMYALGLPHVKMGF